MSDLQPLLDQYYSPDELALAEAGLCHWMVAYWPEAAFCGEDADPESSHRFCAGHEYQARINRGEIE